MHIRRHCLNNARDSFSKTFIVCRAFITYHDYPDRVLLLSMKILNQVFQLVKLKSFFHRFHGRHDQLVTVIEYLFHR